MDTALPQKFPFILDRNLAKANCIENRVCTSCDIVVLGKDVLYQKKNKMVIPGDLLEPELAFVFLEGTPVAAVPVPLLPHMRLPGPALVLEGGTQVVEAHLLVEHGAR